MALGSINLGVKSPATDITITTAQTVVTDEVTGLAALLALCLQLRFAFGSGGTSVKVYVQTSLDGGTTWIDIACAAFTTAAKTVALNFSALTPKLTEVIPTDGTLADDTAIDGILGDRFRLKIVSVGTYAGNTVLSVRGVAR